jgi:hypothetical protein
MEVIVDTVKEDTEKLKSDDVIVVWGGIKLRWEK